MEKRHFFSAFSFVGFLRFIHIHAKSTKKNKSERAMEGEKTSNALFSNLDREREREKKEHLFRTWDFIILTDGKKNFFIFFDSAKKGGKRRFSPSSSLSRRHSWRYQCHILVTKRRFPAADRMKEFKSQIQFSAKAKFAQKARISDVVIPTLIRSNQLVSNRTQIGFKSLGLFFSSKRKTFRAALRVDPFLAVRRLFVVNNWKFPGANKFSACVRRSQLVIQKMILHKNFSLLEFFFHGRNVSKAKFFL